jgi:glycosyltransferase involved in cell wall biosynthesis
LIKVCHLITGLDPGGAERALVNLVRQLPQPQFQNQVVSLTKPGVFAEELNAAGIPLVNLDMRRGVPSISGLGRLVRHLRNTKPTILQTWLYHADLLGTVACNFTPGLRLLWNVRCSDMVNAPGSNRLRHIMRLLRHQSRRPDAIVVNSSSGKRFHEEFGYKPRRWVEIVNGVDTTRFRPRPEAKSELRARFGIDSNAYVIGLVARYHPMKDHETFLRAAAAFTLSHPSARFVLCGKECDSENKHLMRVIAETGLSDRVVLLGIQRDIEMVYPCLDVLTLTSRYGEGSPNVLIEGMACGIPCVSTDAGDSRQTIGASGIVVANGDRDALVAAWKATADGNAGVLASDARARAIDKYRLDRICLEYETLYREIARSADAGILRNADRIDLLSEASAAKLAPRYRTHPGGIE